MTYHRFCILEANNELRKGWFYVEEKTLTVKTLKHLHAGLKRIF